MLLKVRVGRGVAINLGLNQAGDRVTELIEALRKTAQAGRRGSHKLQRIGESGSAHAADHRRIKGERPIDAVESYAEVRKALHVSGVVRKMRDHMLHRLLQ